MILAPRPGRGIQVTEFKGLTENRLADIYKAVLR